VLDGAPLCIALGWAVIIHSTMQFTCCIQLPEPARPILDALLALNIDLGLDTVAIRVGMWSWNGIGLDQQWFGVPWVNLWGWFIVVWSFSGFLRALRSWQRFRLYRWIYAPAAVGLSLVVLLATGELYRFIAANFSTGGLAALLLVVGSVLIVLDSRPRTLPCGRSPSIVTVPLAFHGFAIVAGLSSGIYARQPILAVIGITMMVVGLVVHLLPWLETNYRAISRE
jgi:Carotenoid biosynthesis protein